MRSTPFMHGRAGENGFTLVELMVGVAVAMIGLLVITGVLVVTGQQKQTTSSGADAQTAGAIATYLIERDARMAGFGMNFGPLLNCQIHAYDEGVSPAREFTFSFVPLAITAGTSTTPDSLTITYGSSDVGFNAPRLTQSNNGTNANYKVDNRFGFHEGNLIVVSEDGVDVAPADGIDDCTLAQVTGVPGTPGQTDNVIHNSGNYTNQQGQNVPARYNKPSGMGISYTTNARIYNLGDIPVSKTYSVDTTTNQLLLQNLLAQTTTDNIAENIVFLRAYYGKDTNDDGTVDTYDQTTPTTSAAWQQVIALRFALVARSHKRDAEMVSPASLTLWPAVTTPSGTSPARTLALSDEQRHYRHKVFSTLVPLRNMIWSPE